MNDSILLIQSKQSKNTSMGTGFVIHQDSFGSYVLTCAHVVKQVDEVKIESFEVELIVKGSSDGIDLAVLYVRGLFRTPFDLQDKACENSKVELVGYSVFSKEKYQVKTRAATILEKKMRLTNIAGNQHVTAWQIIAEDNNEIESGNSGAPLFCKKTKKVMAVVSNRKSVHAGYALSIENLKDIWLDMPPLLLEGNDASPFVGLSAFSIAESHLFFGRDKETKKIINRLEKQGLVAVVGDSGSGKSSVIKAGVIPQYLNGILNIEQESKRVFHLIEMRPATNPFNDLASSLNHIDKVFDFKLEDIMYLKEVIESKDSKKILNAFQSLFRKEEVTLLLYIDQFEELFTLCEKELEKEFITLLLYLLESRNSKLRIKIIFTMRRDYYNLIAEYENFFKRTQESKYTLRRMQNDQIKECIEKPLEKTSIGVEQIGIFSKAVLQGMGDESSELTLLQIALTQTWKYKGKYDNNLLRTYHEIGEVSGALAKLADDTWKILSLEEQKILQYIFIRIIKSNETGGVTRRLAKKNEFSDEAWILAQKLSSALNYKGSVANEKNAQFGRLLKIKGEQGKVLELTHEALIKQWPKYQVWLKKVSKDNLKRTHDYVINQNQIYWNQKRWFKVKFLLHGYELERSKKLLEDEYREYLSEDEVRFIKKSLFYRRLSWGVISSIMLIIITLAIFLYLSNNKLNKIENTLVFFLTPSLDRAIEPLLKSPINPKDINFSRRIFVFMVDNFKDDKDKEEVVAKSWFGKGQVFMYDKKVFEVLEIYTKLIEKFKNNQNPKVLEYVVRAWYNKGKILQKDEETASKIYFNLITHFKKSKDSKILEWVAKSWKNRGLLFQDKVEKRGEAIVIFENFLKYFEVENRDVVLAQKLEAYNSLAWYYLLDKDYEKAIDAIENGYEIKKDYIRLDLNLFNIYIISEKKIKAKNLYQKCSKKYGKDKWNQEVNLEIESLKRNNFNSLYFKEIKTW